MLLPGTPQELHAAISQCGLGLDELDVTTWKLMGIKSIPI